MSFSGSLPRVTKLDELVISELLVYCCYSVVDVVMAGGVISLLVA